jgi:hypothetical protein
MGKVIVYLQVRFNYYLYKLGWLWRTNVMSRYVSFKIHHVYGPEKIKYAPNELIVISIVRDGAKYIESFMDHYRVMGICHFVFLDNGSRDDTISKLKGYDHVTILQTNCTYHKYENALKTYLVKRFSQNRWNLFADIDELFDYPYSDKIRVSELLSYLNENRYTAVVAQMLDMFSHLPFSQLEQTKPGSLKSKYTYYDISNIEKRYYKYGKLSNKNIQWHFHGIRSMLFGSNNGLTKAALIFVDGKINPFIDYHQTLDSSVADFSTVLYHYPFTEAFYTKVKEAIETNRYGIWTCEYQRYWDGMTNAPELSMKLPTASCFEGTNKLIEDNFLVVSDKYIQWVNQKRGQIMAGQSKIHGEESLVL